MVLWYGLLLGLGSSAGGFVGWMFTMELAKEQMDCKQSNGLLFPACFFLFSSVILCGVSVTVTETVLLTRYYNSRAADYFDLSPVDYQNHTPVDPE